MKIYHIVTPEVWARYKNKDFYEAESLETENFIHCSYAGQLEAVLDRYYKNARNVLILEIETDKLSSELVEEASTGGEIYPHIYGAINRDAVIKIEEKKIETTNETG